MATIPDLEKHLTPELKAQRAEMLARRGLSSGGFYDQLMVYPELFERVQALGSFVRFDSLLPARVREVEVLMMAVEQRSAFEWQTHVETARAAGVEPALFDGIASGGSLGAFGAAFDELREVVRCVVAQQSVPQHAFDAVAAAYGLKEAVEAVTLACMYRMYASLGAAFESTLPGAAPPPWETPVS